MNQQSLQWLLILTCQFLYVAPISLINFKQFQTEMLLFPTKNIEKGSNRNKLRNILRNELERIFISFVFLFYKVVNL